jgi:putative nucleotidyltransferase with HDIG domain
VRLVRLAVELDLEPDRIAQDAAREHAPLAAGVAGERVFGELRRILGASRAVDGLELLARVGLEDVLLPELAAGRGMAQNRFHDRDVRGHTLAAVQAAIDLQADPEPAVGPELAPAVRGILAEPLADDLDRGGALRWAALLHDIAKPPTRRELPDGRVTFIGHDGLGADMARAVLTRLRASERLRSYVAALTRHHLHLGFLVHERPLARRTIHRYLMATDPLPAT